MHFTKRLRFESKPLILRLLLWTVLASSSTVLMFYVISYVVIPVHILLSPTLDPTLYELGLYGGSPSQTYVSNGLSSPRISTIKDNSQCHNGYTFINFNGDSMLAEGPGILDANNELVWKVENLGTTTNLKVQTYKGEKYLTFWSGKKGGTMGKGIYLLLDATYETKHTVQGVNIEGDLHDFLITKNDTALLTFYNVTEADLTSIGKRKNGWLIDSGFQEVDIATGELIFEWRASDHFSINETFMTHPFGGYIKSIPFNFFHINSVDKDSQGNYLISSRHTHSITCISRDGQIMWILGGRRNQFQDLSGGDALNFRWQHDARWVDEEAGIISLFDNKEAGPLHVDGRYSRGVLVQLDIPSRTVTLLHSYASLHHTRSPSQGSTQYLQDSQHIFVGFGHSPVLSEFTLNGTLLCETHYGAPWLHTFNTAVSYRAFKSANWTGSPKKPPAAKIEADTFYISWNGATEISAWVLQGANDDDDESFVDLDVLDKEFYEETFELDQLTEYTMFRTVALDSSGQILGRSDVVRRPSSSSWWSCLLAIVCGAVSVRVVWLGCRWLVRRRSIGTAKKGVSWVTWKSS